MKKESVTDRVYRELRTDIIRQKYTGNMFLLEKTVCENYGCSKATAGEVLHQLCECGILESYPRKGYILHIPQSREFLQIQRMRMAIEGMEIHWIIRNCSDEAIKAKFCAPDTDLHQMDNETFHLTLATMMEDDRLLHIMENLMAVVIFTYAATPFFSSEDDIGNQHEALIQAILHRDEPLALSILRLDLQYTEE